MRYEKLYAYLPYFQNVKKIDDDLEKKINQFVLMFSNEYLIEKYDDIIGDFCQDEEGWFNVSGCRECLDEMEEIDLLAIISSLIIEDKYLKDLLKSEIKSGFLANVILQIQKFEQLHFILFYVIIIL